MGSRRAIALIALLVLLGACGSSVTGLEDQASEASTVDEAVPSTVPVSPTPEPTATAEPFELALTQAEPGDWRVVVATARPDVTWVDTRASADGEQAELEWGVWNPTPFGTELALQVVEGDASDEWIEVRVAVPPNESTAWVRSEQFTFSSHEYHAEIDLSAHQVTVWDGDTVVVQTAAVVGAAGSRTPLGTYFVNDKVAGGGGAYGPWILSLSAFSEDLDTFNGGEPVIAIHGTNRPELVGQSLSNGCVRVPNDIIEVLAENVPLGTPVTIIA